MNYEALKQVVKGLERSEDALHKARANLNQAIAEAEQAQPKCSAIVEVFKTDWRLEYMSLPVGKHKLYTQQYNYAAPPDRVKPLTEKEIDAAWRSCDYTVPWEQHRIDIARAIEAAHGIKE